MSIRKHEFQLICQYIRQGRIESLMDFLKPLGVNSTFCGFTPLMVAAVAPSDSGVESALALLDAGADAEAVDFDNKNACHWAIEKDNCMMVDLLVKAKISVAVAVTSRGVTPLMMAVERNNTRIVKALSNLGIEAKEMNSLALPIGRLAEQLQSWSSAMVLRDKPVSKQVVEALTEREKAAKCLCSLAAKGKWQRLKQLTNSTNVNVRWRGLTPLMHAAAAANSKGAACGCLLLRLGASHSMSDLSGLTAVHMAAQADNASMLMVLASADINALDRRGWTPLMLAAYNRCYTAAEALVLMGANPKVQDLASRTAVDLAEASGNSKLLRLIRSAWHAYG